MQPQAESGAPVQSSGQAIAGAAATRGIGTAATAFHTFSASTVAATSCTRRMRAPRCAADYQAKVSGPLLDRIDLHVDVQAVSAADLVLPPPAEGGPQPVIGLSGTAQLALLEAADPVWEADDVAPVPPGVTVTGALCGPLGSCGGDTQEQPGVEGHGGGFTEHQGTMAGTTPTAPASQQRMETGCEARSARNSQSGARLRSCSRSAARTGK